MTIGMTPEERQELREAALRAHTCCASALWRLQTSNSFRRLGSYGDGNVLCAIVQRSDGQPDLMAAPGVLDYIVASQPCVMLKLLEALDEAEAAQQGVTSAGAVAATRTQQGVTSAGAVAATRTQQGVTSAGAVAATRTAQGALTAADLYGDGWFGAAHAVDSALALLRHMLCSEDVREILSQAVSALLAAQSKIDERIGA
jgi:hypothetical protein